MLAMRFQDDLALHSFRDVAGQRNNTTGGVLDVAIDIAFGMFTHVSWDKEIGS